MGKYNFSAQRFMEIEKRLAELEKANEELRAENASLRKPKKPSHKDRGVMNNWQNSAVKSSQWKDSRSLRRRL